MFHRERVAFFALLLALLLPVVTGAEVRFEPMTNEQVALFMEDVAAGTEGRDARSLPAPAADLIVPYFEVDTTDPFGETTLFALRTVNLSAAATCNVYYDNVFGTNQASQLSVVVPGAGVWPRNLRDVPGLPVDPDGYKRGYVRISCNNNVSGDMMQVNPGEDFASGARVIADDDLCVAWDIRFLGSGAFSGGTTFSMYHSAPGGIAPGDPPTAAVTVSGEDGTIWGSPIGLQTDQRSIEFGLGQIIAALPGGFGPANGSFWWSSRRPEAVASSRRPTRRRASTRWG